MAQDNDSRSVGPERPTTGNDAERYPERRPARRIVMILFVGLAICGVMVPVLLANNGRNLEILGDRLGLQLHDWWRGKMERVQQSPQLQPPAASPQVAEPEQPRRHTIPTPALSNPPSHLAAPAEPWQPEIGCNALEPGVTGEKPVFLQAPDGRSECTVLIVLSYAEKASSLFLQVRAAGNNLSSLRMKLNFGEDDQAAVLPQKAGDLAQRILTPISADERAYLQDKMAGRQAFRTEIGDYRMTFRAEGNDMSRFNFIAVSKVKEQPLVEETQDGSEAVSQPPQP